MPASRCVAAARACFAPAPARPPRPPAGRRSRAQTSPRGTCSSRDCTRRGLHGRGMSSDSGARHSHMAVAQYRCPRPTVALVGAHMLRGHVAVRSRVTVLECRMDQKAHHRATIGLGSACLWQDPRIPSSVPSSRGRSSRAFRRCTSRLGPGRCQNLRHQSGPGGLASPAGQGKRGDSVGPGRGVI